MFNGHQRKKPAEGRERNHSRHQPQDRLVEPKPRPEGEAPGDLGEDRRGAFIGGTLLNMAVFGAMFSYVMQGLSFIRLRRKFPGMDRPYRSPFGVPGAALTVTIAALTIYFQLQDPVFRAGVAGVSIWFAIGIAYFAIVGRHRLILSPEEEFALERWSGR